MRAKRALYGLLTALLAGVLLAGSPAVATAIGAIPPPPSLPVYDPMLDAATRRALELEQTISDLRAEQTAIETRIQVTSERIAEQTTGLERAQRELRQAQTAFNERAVAMYKFTGYDELAILLAADSWQDLVTRVAVISHVLDVDRRALEEASVVAAQARYQSSALDDLRAQDTDFRQLQEQRVRLVATALAEQEPLVATLPAEGGAAVATAREDAALLRKRWRDSSIPLTTPVRKVAGKVLPYTDRSYLVSEFHPKAFRTTALTYSAVCSSYGPGFDTKTMASGQLHNQNDFTCASRTHALGTWLALSRDGKRIVALVTDRGPYVAQSDLELSKAAADALDIAGVESVQLEVVSRR